MRFDRYGGRDVLVTDVPRPTPPAGEVVVAVKAAGIKTAVVVLAKPRSALAPLARERFPATFPSGQGSDLAGVVTDARARVPMASRWATRYSASPGRRSSHATHVSVPEAQLIAKPDRAALGGRRRSVRRRVHGLCRGAGPSTPKRETPSPVSAAAGGVGTIVVQLLGLRGAQVLGIASPARMAELPRHSPRLPTVTATGERLRAAAPEGIDAFIDLFGPDYVQLAADMGIPRDRIETITTPDKAAELGAKAEGNVWNAPTPEVLTEMAGLVASGTIGSVAATYPLEQVVDAFAELEQHGAGKIVLIP